MFATASLPPGRRHACGTHFSFVAQDVALHKVSAPEASCAPLLVTPARANGTEWFTAFPAAQEVAVHEVSAPEASCPALLDVPAGRAPHV